MDFNFDWLANESTNSNVRKMKDLLLSFNHIQHVLEPTHTSGHVCNGTILLGVGTCVCQRWGDGECAIQRHEPAADG